jgi:hypothetical protein
MHSPLARVILTVLGGYLLILLLMTAYDWIEAEFPRPPDMPTATGAVQHPFHHEKALAALASFARLPEAEKNALRRSLEAGLISMDTWLDRLGRRQCPVLCLGELHAENTRRFLAGTFFGRYPADVLMLETTPDGLARLTRRMEAGRAYFPLLEADILAVLRAARSGNAAVQIVGIEETEAQQAGREGRSGSRDRAIARNFWQRYHPGRRHVVLFGALHCADEAHWLFGNLKRQAPPALAQRMVNARVLGEHQSGPVEAFVFLLDGLGLAPADFVVADTDALHPLITTWLPLLKAQILDKFQVLIVFRDTGAR